MTIDDKLPLDKSGYFKFAKGGKDGSLWGPLLEKGFAKMLGTYENMVAGDPIESIRMLSGAPATRHYSSASAYN